MTPDTGQDDLDRCDFPTRSMSDRCGGRAVDWSLFLGRHISRCERHPWGGSRRAGEYRTLTRREAEVMWVMSR